MTPLQKIREAYTRLTAFTPDDMFAVDALASVFAAANYKALPKRLWLYLIGPSGTGKNVMLHPFTGLPTYHKVSMVTANALLSAYDPGEKGVARAAEEDPSVILKWNGKVVIFEDFTTQLNKGTSQVEDLLGQLRDVFDGRLVKASGTVGEIAANSKFGLVLACTEELDVRTESLTQMGERFFTVRIGRTRSNTLRGRTEETSRVAVLGRRQHMWQDELLLTVTHEMAEIIKALPDIPSLPDPSIDVQLTLSGLANAVMAFRSRAVKGTLQEVPTANRLVTTLSTAATIRAFLDMRGEPNQDDLDFARRLAWDALDGPTGRMANLLWLAPSHTTSVDQLHRMSGIGDRIKVDQILNQWDHINLIEPAGQGLVRFNLDTALFLDGLGFFRGAPIQP